MCSNTLREDEIFFGIVSHDASTRSSLVKRQPTLAELEVLRKEHPFMFSHRCECGATAWLYSHVITTREDNPHMVASSLVYLHCPECGRRFSLGANYHLQHLALKEIERVTHATDRGSSMDFSASPRFVDASELFPSLERDTAFVLMTAELSQTCK